MHRIQFIHDTSCVLQRESVTRAQCPQHHHHCHYHHIINHFLTTYYLHGAILSALCWSACSMRTATLHGIGAILTPFAYGKTEAQNVVRALAGFTAMSGPVSGRARGLASETILVALLPLYLCRVSNTEPLWCLHSPGDLLSKSSDCISVVLPRNHKKSD